MHSGKARLSYWPLGSLVRLMINCQISGAETLRQSDKIGAGESIRFKRQLPWDTLFDRFQNMSIMLFLAKLSNAYF